MNELPADISFEDWVRHVFDHPYYMDTDDGMQWWFVGDEPFWNEDANPALAIDHLTRFFADPAILIARYSHAQIDQGLNYLFSNACSNYMFLFRNEEVPWEKRAACVEAIESLYADLMAPVFGDDLGHLHRGPGDPEKPNFACYMWWDIAPICPSGEGEDKLTALLLQVFAKVLRLRSEACLESVLHGLGHWTLYIPDQARPLIESFLQRTDLSPAIRAYAEQAATGQIQ